MSTTPYRAAGTFSGISYVPREADRLLLRAIEQNQRYPYIVAARQSGKSSLLLRTCKTLEPTRYLTAFVDLSTFNLDDYDQFWHDILDEIAQHAKLDSTEIDSRKPEITLAKWLAMVPGRLVVFLDEIDSLLHVPFREQFFSKVRALFNRRALDREFERLLIVLAGAVHPTQLITNGSRSPFNVGVEIELDTLTLERTEHLVSFLGDSGTHIDSGVATHIRNVTGGSPFLCQLVLEHIWNDETQSSAVTIKSVNATIERIAIRADHEIHFLNIYQLISNNERALTALTDLWAGRAIDELSAQELRIIGISDGTSTFRNQIYARVFGQGGQLDLGLGAGQLFGRENELAWLDMCWRKGIFVASIVAWGGVGKTALVKQWLANMRNAGWRGAARRFEWSFYRQGTSTAGSSDRFFAKALEEFGDSDPTKGSPWDKGERLAKRVREKRTLLVLDGVELMQYGPGDQEGRFKDPALQTLVTELAQHNNGLLLITSRIPLRDLSGLQDAKVQTKALEHLSVEAGANLLKARGAKGSKEELRATATEYNGHALALTLLGSYLDDVAEGDIRRRKEIGPLVYDERNGGHARRVMDAYLPWLGTTELAILRILGLFDRPTSADEIDALRADPVVPGLTDILGGVSGDDWDKSLTRLRHIGLIAVESSSAIDAHPLVRQHFGEQLRQEHVDAWREGHRRLYMFLQKKAPFWPDTLTEMAPLYAAVMHGCLAGKNQEALDEVWWKRIRRRTEEFSFKKLGAFDSEVALLSAFFDPPWEHIASGLNEVWQTFLLNAAGHALRALGRLHEAVGLLRLGLKRALAREDWTNAAIAASNISELLQSRGDLPEALETALQSVQLGEKSGDVFQRIVNRARLAAVLHAMGQREKATALFEEAERMQQDMQPTYPMLYALPGFQYCDLMLNQGREVDVRERAAIFFVWRGPGDSLLDIALDHLSLGRAHLASLQRGTGGEIEEATSHIQQAVEGLRRANVQEFIPLGFLARAALHIHTRASKDARRDLDEAQLLATRCGFRLHEADVHISYVRLAIAEGHVAAAREHLGKAQAIVHETGYHRRDEELEKCQHDLSRLMPGAHSIRTSVKPTVSQGSTERSEVSTLEEPADLGIIVTLQEEFRELVSLSGSLTRHDDEHLTVYRFQRGPYRLVATFVGDMGEAHAVRVTERMISLYQPKSIVVVGIATSVHDDLCIGDVYVPRRAVEYMQDAKMQARKNYRPEFTVVPSALVHRTDNAFLHAVINLDSGYPDIGLRFREECAKDLKTLVPDASERDRLFANNVVHRATHCLAAGHIATVPVLGGSAAFSSWIRTNDRNVKALELESSAVLLPTQLETTRTCALTIRGISDYADDRKTTLGNIDAGVLRQYAMRNAVRFLWALLDANALPRRSA